MNKMLSRRGLLAGATLGLAGFGVGRAVPRRDSGGVESFEDPTIVWDVYHDIGDRWLVGLDTESSELGDADGIVFDYGGIEYRWEGNEYYSRSRQIWTRIRAFAVRGDWWIKVFDGVLTPEGKILEEPTDEEMLAGLNQTER